MLFTCTCIHTQLPVTGGNVHLITTALQLCGQRCRGAWPQRRAQAFVAVLVLIYQYAQQIVIRVLGAKLEASGVAQHNQ